MVRASAWADPTATEIKGLVNFGNTIAIGLGATLASLTSSLSLFFLTLFSG